MKKSVFLLLILFFSNSASADYLRALIAYRNADSKSVFSEIEDAVKTKNNYAFVLFLDELHFGYKENPDNLITVKNDAGNFSYSTVIPKEKILHLIQLLETSSNTAPLEYQYYFFKKRNYLLKQIATQSDR